MPIACCNLDGIYIDSNGSISKDFITKHFGENAEVVTKERTDDGALYIQSKTGNLPVDTFVIHDGKETELCTCACHGPDGLSIIH